MSRLTDALSERDAHREAARLSLVEIERLKGELREMIELNAVNESGCNNALDKLQERSKLFAETSALVSAMVEGISKRDELLDKIARLLSVHSFGWAKSICDDIAAFRQEEGE